MNEITEPTRPCWSVIIPVYNEAAKQGPVQELIIVDDCSSDTTLEYNPFNKYN